MLVLTGLAYLFPFMQPAGASGTVPVELSSAGGDRLAPTPVKLGPKTLNVAGDAPRAPKVKEAARLSLPPGTYRLTVGGVPQPAALTVADNQVQPILLVVSRARVAPGGVYAGSENFNLGLSEAGGQKQPVADFDLTD